MLQLSFQQKFNGTVWRICFDDTGKYLAVETRNAEDRSTSFSCIDLENGKLSIDHLVLEEKWFCGMETLCNGHLLLHGYLSEQLPEHRGIFAYKLQDGQLAWKNYNLVFGSAVREGIIAWNYKIEPRRYELLNAKTGKQIKASNSLKELKSHILALKLPIVQLPEVIPSGEYAFIEQQFPDVRMEDGEFFANGEKRIFSVYVPKGKEQLSNYLLVFDRHKQLLLKELIADDVILTGKETFFILNNRLFYIKMKREIISYFL